MITREYFPGMGQAVADRTINRGSETWGDVSHRVALGNSLLDPRGAAAAQSEYQSLRNHLSQASTLMSGRHLQHGDADQPSRPQEVFTNCATAMFRFLTFKLLLSGSGVGSCYDDALMTTDWSKNMPTIACTLDQSHPDYSRGNFMDLRTARHFYRNAPKTIVHEVEDSREGWAKAIELIERLTAGGQDADTVVILDFSKVRELGQPIKGMQNRPASGPIPLMNAIVKVALVRGSGMEPWLASMWIDHYLAECVLVGGARRAARIAVKHWKDKSIFTYINLKRPAEFEGLSREQVIELRKFGGKFDSFLWSSNNSVAVDREFWERVARARKGDMRNAVDRHAYRVWRAVMDRQFGDGTGEPGFLNVDKLETNDVNIDQYMDTMFAGSDLYQLDNESRAMVRELTSRVLAHHYHYIVNPCGEIVLFLLGGFCVIADVVPFHAANDDDAEDAFRVSARALIRVNLMNSIYHLEVARTNRIGVGMTGLHEYMWARFGLGFRDAIAKGDVGPLGVTEKAAPFWNMLKRFADAVDDECRKYAAELGVTIPHTNRTMKPAGTTSKLFGLTEAAHLPSMRKLLRWVQFRNDDPLVAKYRAAGYPVRELKSYSGTTIVGFPTAPIITTLGMGDKLVTANEASIEEQFRWLQLLEHYWLGQDTGNQISYTLKYEPAKYSFEDFEALMFENVRNVRAVSVMPFEDTSSYEYLPEEPVSDAMFDYLLANINESLEEDVDRAHVDCASGACPIDFEKAGQ